MFQRVLVALSENELEQWVQTPIFAALKSLRLEPEAKIILSHVVPVTAQELERGMDQHHESELLLQRKTEEVQVELADHLKVEVDLEVTSGEPGDEIVRLANIHHADLIILGSRGLKGVSRVLNQSVSGQVCEETPCSVLIVKRS